MSEYSPPTEGRLERVLDRVATPLFIFSGVLAVILILSSLFLLPRLTKVEVSGTLFSVSQMQDHRAELVGEVAVAEGKRHQFVLALHDEAFDALKALRASAPSFPSVESDIRGAAAAVSTQPDAVHLDAMRFDTAKKHVVLTGDVRFVATRSMTVLAEFVEALRRLPFSADVSTPRYVRDDTPGTGPHSPFTVTLTLQ